ncbi:unnamed protein product [Alopecurus aequalis]
MEWQPEQLDLGALGFAGIFRETFRVLRCSILPNSKGGPGAAILSALLLLRIAGEHALLYRLVDTGDGSHLVRFLAGLVGFYAFDALFIFALQLSLVCTAAYVFRVATLYCTDGDSGASDRILRDLPRAPVARLGQLFQYVLPLALTYVFFSGILWFVLLHVEGSNEAVVLALHLLGGAAFFAMAAYVALVSHIACVVAAFEELEVVVGLGTLRKSRALLAGKFWTAAAVFVALDGFFVGLHVLFLELVLEDTLGLGRGFQPVVYLVCKSHHHEVVHKGKAHLNYVGEYQPLAVNGVELQPVKTEQITDTSQSPAGSS